jgi:cytochrome P450
MTATSLPHAPVTPRTPARDVPSPSLPLFGLPELFAFLKDPLRTLQTRASELGPVYRMSTLGRDSIVLLGPDANERVFGNREQIFANKPMWDEQIGRYFGGGLLLRDFDEHRAHRLIMNAAFTDTALRSYVEGMQRVIGAHLSSWPREADETFLAFPALKLLTLEVAARVFLGEPSSRKAGSLNRAFLDTVRASGTGNLIPWAIPGTLTARGVAGRAMLERYLFERIEPKRRSNDTDLFALLCRGETRGDARFTPKEIVDHLIFLLMAAHDTSTLTATTLFAMLGRHQGWQERCREEVLALGDGPIGYDDLDKLPLLDLAMKEALRILPPLPFTGRRALEDFEIEGVRVKKGQNVTIAPLHTHHMPSLWTDPHLFDPMRFSPERAEHKRHRYAYVPFGGGVHKCLGMRFAELEVRSILAHVLRTRRWTVPNDYVMPLDFTSLPIPKDGLPIRIQAVESRT